MPRYRRPGLTRFVRVCFSPFQKSLGEGGHGKVAKATVGGELVALKQLPLSDPQTHRELDVVRNHL